MENSVLKEKSVKCSRSIKILALACLVLSLVSLVVSSFHFVVLVNENYKGITAYQSFVHYDNGSLAAYNWSTVILSAIFTAYIFFFYEKVCANGLIAVIFFVFMIRACLISILFGYTSYISVKPYLAVKPYSFLFAYGPILCLFGVFWSLKRFNQNKRNLLYSIVGYLLTEGSLLAFLIYKVIRYVYRPRYNLLAPVLYDTVTFVLCFAGSALLCIAIYRFVTTHTVFSAFLPRYNTHKGLRLKQALACRKLDRMYESGLLTDEEYCAACDDIVEQYK